MTKKKNHISAFKGARNSIVMAFVMMLVFFVANDSNGMRRYAGDDARYTLVFRDDFDGKVLDTLNWRKIHRQPYRWSRYMSDATGLYKLAHGRLRLFAVPNDGLVPSDSSRYLTAGISTQGLRSFTYGKVEVRARIHAAVGTWPAIWLLTSTPSKVWPDPDYAEIDILEYPNREGRAYNTLHSYYTMELKKTDVYPNKTFTYVDAEKYNVYAVEVLPDMVIFSINGKETLRYPKIETDDIGQFPFGIDSYLLIDMQVGPTPWITKVDDSTFPAYMDVDWVKIYELKH